MYLAKKKIKKASDFTTAGQSLGTFTVAGSIISTCMGASILFSNYQSSMPAVYARLSRAHSGMVHG
mgnify:CR=1 FL=1